MVTIIIPNYNHAKYLPQRIESVLQQTYANTEVIILDDCSSDNSREIIERFAKEDKRIKVIYNEQNSGSTFKQWNKGIALAKGEYIWIAESDDYSDLFFLEKLVLKLDANSDIGLAYCDSLYVDENGKVIDRNYSLYSELDVELWENDFTVDGLGLVKKFMSYKNIIPNASAVVFRRSIAQQVGPADEKMRLVGDWLYWASILAVSQVVFVAEQLNYFRQHINNVRSRTFINGIYFVELTYLLGLIQKYGEPNNYFFNKIVADIFRMWLQEDLENQNVPYEISVRRHYNIYKNLINLNKSVEKQANDKIKKFMLTKSYNKARNAIGNGVFYRFLKALLLK
ncbi:glycosyltransferase [Hymenobacter sp. BT559]|uniref:glycosyltransferase n=1 Tax=Hymenobacter sp. BT559 TaxID=2795729 RepID=UPI0018EB8F6C|nr:glycosyltransferase [Hymenobacter sp. BT559]